MQTPNTTPLLARQEATDPGMGCRMLKHTCAPIANAATFVLTQWRKFVRQAVICPLVVVIMLVYCISVVVYMSLGDVPILDGLHRGKLLAVVALVAIAFSLAGDFFPALLAYQSRAHPDGGLEAKEQISAHSTPCVLVACKVWALLLPVGRTVCNVVVLGGFLEHHFTMAGIPHTEVQDCRAVGELVLAALMVLSVPSYQLGFVSRCITAHNKLRCAAEQWREDLSTLATHPASYLNPVPFIRHFETASAAVGAVNEEYTTTLGVVITVRTSFILAYTALQLIVGSPTSSWVYVIAPGLELLNLLYAASTVTQEHHKLVKWASTAAFHVQGDLRAAGPAAAVGQPAHEVRVDLGPAIAYMVGATRLADHVKAHRSSLAIQVWSPLGKFDVTRSYVLRLTVGIGTSLLTLFLKDIIIENLRVAGIVVHQ